MSDTEKTVSLIDNLELVVTCSECGMVHTLEELKDGTHCVKCDKDLTGELF